MYIILTKGVTNAGFYSMVEVFLFFDRGYALRHDVTDVLKDVPGDNISRHSILAIIILPLAMVIATKF